MAALAPLSGIKVVEFAGLAPGPFVGMVLADFGADVIRIDRPGESDSSDILARGKRSLAISPKTPAGRNALLSLIAKADVLIDPFRPGVLERLGFGPQDCQTVNPGLVFARLTGYKRTGPRSSEAGHDINYLAVTGVLAMLRPQGGIPYPPLNLAADFAGGAMVCVVGILVALLQRHTTGSGQVVEADMVSGTRYVASFPLLSSSPDAKSPYFGLRPGENILDGGAPFYDVYKTSDGKFISVGCLEPKFYAVFIETLVRSLTIKPTSPPVVSAQYDRSSWPKVRNFLREAFLTRTRDEWSSIFLNTDACVAPVLQREEVIVKDGAEVPVRSPNLSGSGALKAGTLAEQFLNPGRHTREVLQHDLGMTDREVESLLGSGTVSEYRGDSKL